MSVLFSILAVLAGLAFGSFLNVCISRLPRHESVIAPRSRCPRCLAPVLARDNVPLLSWALLGGRCRSCRVPIPARYPLVELATAALFLLSFLEYGLTLRGAAAAALCWLLLGLAVTDAETMLLPDALTLPGVVLGVIYSGLGATDGALVAFSWKASAESLLWAACAAALVMLVRGLYRRARSREGMGLGDVKLLAMIAAWLGPGRTLLVLFLGVVTAAAFGLSLIGWREARSCSTRGQALATRIPLGAFLSSAGILSLFEGGSILKWYLTFFR